MNKRFFIQLKAAFLLVVFGLNTMSGFACAIGLNLGFDPGQHPGKITARLLARDDKNVDQQQVVNAHARLPEAKSCHSTPDKSQTGLNHNNDYDAAGKGRNCCGDKMIRFDKLDKSVVKSVSIINPLFLQTFVSNFLDVDAIPRSRVTPHFKYFIRSCHLPIPDLRVIIQSFQV